jgi:hypothetical protein
MKKTWGLGAGIFLLVAIVWIAFSGLIGPQKTAVGGLGYVHIALLSDLHLPGNMREAKERVVDNINSWGDVSAVAVLGDTVQTRGTKDEYLYSKTFFGRLKPPILAITGNHDFLYDDTVIGGRNKKGMPDQRQEKLERFRELFSLAKHYYTKQMQGYLLVFLSADDLQSAHLASISSEQRDWLQKILAANRQIPTIIFFHAPLQNTYSGNGDNVGKEDFAAQPAEFFDGLFEANRQVFMWVSGHIHLAPSHRSFRSAENLYKGRVNTLHNPDLNGSSYLLADDVKTSRHQGLVTNSLFLYPDRVVVRLYDHNARTWLPGERSISTPKY